MAAMRNVLKLLAVPAAVASRVQGHSSDAVQDAVTDADEELKVVDASLLEKEANVVAVNNTRAEDVECFCMPPYLYADLDDDDVNAVDCFGSGDDHLRCDNICQRKGKQVYFEGQTQTISFCGGDKGEPDLRGETECQCFDLEDTLKDKSNKKKTEKLYEKGKISSKGEGWMVKNVANFNRQYSSEDNLKDCYRHCPDACHDKYMVTAGCAYPTREPWW
eukprot:TRINITY_DN11004_c0_g1_i1.p1 TRINITY_DN11004_c0_g1~~TRINITY_DN11004_c0_g1_i1.p1  ORF type:complete len:249 (+),score=66.95 TRINITY_DN11004_c0_g1_i1:91-747(+)